MSDAAERMSRVDTAWLRMDNDVNLMMIVGVWLLTPAVTLEALRERIADKLLKYERFRQKTVVPTPWARDVGRGRRLRHHRHVVPESLHAREGRAPNAQALQACAANWP
jgi:diacylglycerol O-acyltransferase